MDLPFVKLLEVIANKGGTLINKFVKDKDLAAKITHELKMSIQEDDTDIALAVEESHRAIKEADAQIRIAELHQNDTYTKRTRPKIARQSWYLAMAYTAATVITKVLPTAWGVGVVSFEWYIFIAIASPAMEYMGVRSIDKWKNGKA
jgi:hypothetical protein